ncbi:hypothetical protein CC86DRAFT_409976 [Ophiobolus disseminans]|uniref:Uncharacterized protein n=1 Tax=Ophiobolus disseminans TaxID=1469910 RepID=A0A6A6ZQ33_9PLEO|nr:hypothetical protein CC86DRAFT_409976 [Ophiobolus disseminans]
MPITNHLKPVLPLLLLLSSIAHASRFSFSISEITVQRTRDVAEDDLFLALASTAGSSTTNHTFPLVSVKEGSIIKWDNLTQEIDVPAAATNLSIAIGVLNNANDDEDKAVDTSLKFAQAILTIAARVPGPQAPAANLLGIVSGFIGADMFNCDGAVAVGNVVYTIDTLNGMDKGKKVCETRPYAYESPKALCGVRGSNYTVIHCLERLDDKAASGMASGVQRGSLWAVGLVGAVLWGSVGVLL